MIKFVGFGKIWKISRRSRLKECAARHTIYKYV